MAKLTPQQAREKHARNLKNSSQDIALGVERVTVAPGVKAAAKAQKMRQNLIQSIDDGTWAKRVASVPLDEWKDKMVNKGIGRISAGIDAAAGKMEDFYGELFPYQDNLKSKVDKMPDLTLDDNINRMTTYVRGMSNFKRK